MRRRTRGGRRAGGGAEIAVRGGILRMARYCRERAATAGRAGGIPRMARMARESTPLHEALCRAGFRGKVAKNDDLTTSPSCLQGMRRS